MTHKFTPLQLVEQITPRGALGLCAVSALMLLLVGCQSLEQTGAWLGRQADQGWVKTQQAVRSVLRPAPHDSALFTHAPSVLHSDNGDAALNQRRLEQMVWIAGLQSASSAQYPWNAQADVQTYQAPSRAYQQAAIEPRAADAVSYVKLDGTLSMTDWTQCEAQTGGAFIVSPTGTSIADDFDQCMRARGYLPESEAEAVLAGG